MRIRKPDGETAPRLMTAAQAQTYAGLGRTVFRRWSDGIGATVKIGGTVRFDREIIDRALDERREF